ncbi:hypothetical protein HMPREF0541_01182 [Lacticaseibacillus rhamnosus ATCC 21052]|nr:hypothetical protein HMPREF0541_01182 [Lacticaseibacillus rhamnosus ATCC 21052]
MHQFWNHLDSFLFGWFFCCPKYASFLGDLEAFAVYLQTYHFDPAPSN